MKKIRIFGVIILTLTLIMASTSVFAIEEQNQTEINNEVLKTNVAEAVGITYHTHIQNYGWESTWTSVGNTSGTEGQSLRLEGIQIKLTGDNLPTGAKIEYRTHVQNNGWESTWTNDGNTAGTEGQSLRLEAIEMRLLNMPGYSVQYRVHVQNEGWETAWSADGESAGTEGRSLRLEAIEIKVVKIVPTPESLTAQAASQSISLVWNAVAGADSYTVYQAASMDGDYTEVTTNITGTAFQVINLEDGKRYYYKIKATAGATASKLSEAATAIASVDDQGNVFLGNQLLISNQSTDIGNTQSTGTLTPAADVMETANLGQSEFGTDVVLPFEPANGQKPIDPNDPTVLGTSEVYVQNSTKDFYTYNFNTDSFEQTHARLAYIGTHVQIWVDANDPAMVMTDEDAQAMAAEFDNRMYPLITENFYTESDVNNDGKIAILCYNIKDMYTGTGTGDNPHYISGYFYAGDLFNTETSNKMEVFYADTYPSMGTDAGIANLTKIYGTVIHEFQHMVNFNCSQFVEQSEEMDLWLNEALSLAASVMYDDVLASAGEENDGYTSHMFQVYNTSDAIRNGRSLLDFTMTDEDPVSNYALSYLFSQYLRTQVDAALGTGNNVKMFNEIITDPGNSTEAVEHVIQKYIDPNLTFDEFMTNYRAAMILKADSGTFGFNGEEAYDALSTPLYTGGTTNLSGGGAIVTTIDSPFTDPADQGPDVNYLGIFK